MLPSDVPTALRCEQGDQAEVRVGWAAVVDNALLALLHGSSAGGHWSDTLLPHFNGHHTYVSAAPDRPCPEWGNLIAAFNDHGMHATNTWQTVRANTLRRDYRRRVRARLLELRNSIGRRCDDLWLRWLRPWSPASHLPQACCLCGTCDVMSSNLPAGTNRCTRCSQVVASPWQEQAPGPRRRTEHEALRWRNQEA